MSAAPDDRDLPASDEASIGAAPAAFPRAFLDRAAEIAADPHGWEFGAAVRTLQAAAPDTPAVGRSGRIEEDPIRFAQPPSLRFEASEIRAARWIDLGGRSAFEISQIAIGPLGPKGALPTHVTEDAMREEREGRRWLTGFLDIFTHRIAGLLFRAWALARPAVCRDTPAIDPWPRWVNALFGAAPEAFHERDALPDDAKRHMSGWLSMGRATAAGLSGVLGVVIGARVAVEEFEPEWLDIPDADQARLGRGPARLGEDVILGARSHSVQSRVRVRAGPLGFDRYDSLLPGGDRHAAARDAVLSLAGLSLAWELQLDLRPDEAPPPRLAAAQRLGWDSWLGKPRGRADDLVLRMEYSAPKPFGAS